MKEIGLNLLKSRFRKVARSKLGTLRVKNCDEIEILVGDGLKLNYSILPSNARTRDKFRLSLDRRNLTVFLRTPRVSSVSCQLRLNESKLSFDFLGFPTSFEKKFLYD